MVDIEPAVLADHAIVADENLTPTDDLNPGMDEGIFSDLSRRMGASLLFFPRGGAKERKQRHD
jgi:hypothetical protein